jgi:aspartyl-tRNA(Asn)/glutamyl-tRNA(Gln) amidotransferase subunit A
MYLEDIFTVTVNMAGLPGLSVPAGLSSEGTPLGLQLIGKPFDEETLFRAGQAIEDAAGRFKPSQRWWTESAPAAGTALGAGAKKSAAGKKPKGK